MLPGFLKGGILVHQNQKHRSLLPRHWAQRLLAAAIVVVLALTAFTLSVFAQNTYIITDGERVTSCKSFSSDPDKVLSRAGIPLGQTDTYTTEHENNISYITIRRAQQITVVCDGQRTAVESYGESVEELLDRMGITLGEDDKISCNADEMTFDGMTIEIIRIRTERLAYEGTLSFDTVIYESDKLSGGESKTLQAGQDGQINYTALVTYADGEEISREVLSEEVVCPMVSEVILRGISRSTKEQYDPAREIVTEEASSASSSSSSSSSSSGSSSSSSGSSSRSGSSSSSSGGSGSAIVSDNGGSITTASGEVLHYQSLLTCSGTGYTCPGYTGYTYTGTVARVGEVAVDPNVIPLGSVLYIVTDDGFCVYGLCTAEDIGGAVKGNSVDLYFNTLQECYDFGRRTCTVYIISTP